MRFFLSSVSKFLDTTDINKYMPFSFQNAVAFGITVIFSVIFQAKSSRAVPAPTLSFQGSHNHHHHHLASTFNPQQQRQQPSLQPKPYSLAPLPRSFANKHYTRILQRYDARDRICSGSTKYHGGICSSR
uniref:Uncharacterized protein n=1 Tax=Ditylum brightwellii TaxID=49249 RepID=A0A6U4AGJ3_9STRA